MPEDRRLAAIMFTDIVGYTALMGWDEDKAFDMLKQNHAIHESLIKNYRGTLIKEIGNGTLASFSLTSDAVRCAMEIQKACKGQNIPLKIGIHEGEMVFAGGDVLGDGVNIASRLQEAVEEGCITISGSVYRNIKNKAGIRTEFIEERSFKNVDEPIRVYKVLCEKEEPVASEEQPAIRKSKRPYFIIGSLLVLIVAVVLIWFIYPRQQIIVEETEVEKSIAVLPFKNLSPEDENQYFADGVMEGILNHLSKIKDLRVVSRSSTEQYRDNASSAQQMGQELNVTFLLEASIFNSEGRIRVIAQLIDATKDEHLWSEQYDRELKDVFEVMSDISQEVVSEVRVIMPPEVKKRIESLPTENLKAYDLYLKGKEYEMMHYRSWSFTSMGSAIHLFQKAIELDYQFALAYIPLGNLIYDLITEKNTSPAAWFEESMGDTLLYYADKALAIDPNLADGYWLLGQYHYYVKSDYIKSLEFHKKAFDLDIGTPSEFELYKNYFNVFTAIYDYQRAKTPAWLESS